MARQHPAVLILLIAAPALAGAGCTQRGATDPAAVPDGTITAAAMQAHIAALAHDSMRGRWTPSAELNAAADYAADVFLAAGLAPAPGGNYLRTWDVEGATAPNAVAVLEGGDPARQGEYVLFVAHLDHIGTTGQNPRCAAVGADSICNGADDNASGSAAVLELARAFARVRPRPGRSLLFLLVSGEERGLWGSEAYALTPARPLSSTVAAINLDMISRNAPDYLEVLAGELTTLGALADEVAHARGELGLRLTHAPWDAGGSDHWQFLLRGVPSLCFYAGSHADYHRVTDSAGAVDAEKAARVARLAFHLGLAIANRAPPPAWITDVPPPPARAADLLR